MACKKTAVKVLTLGCPKNTVDSEVMKGLLHEKGYTLTDRADRADVFIVNTCAFIEPAKEESVEVILETARWKEQDPSKRLIVTGCLAQRYAKELAAEMPEVDAFVGTSEFIHIAEVVEAVQRGSDEPLLRISSPVYPYTQLLPRRLATPWHIAYLKVGEGCDNRCTFCAIPSFRGDYVSRPMEMLVHEAEILAASGVKELVLISQDTTYYGRDRYGQFRLPELLRRLARVDGIEWIRILYAYPSLVNDELLDVLRDEPKVCAYLDVPFQHIDNEILRKMARGTKESFLRELVPYVRERVPNVTLRTSFIVGFPGETDEQFEKLLDFVGEARFEHVGVFRFSPEEGTPAATMPNPLPLEVVEERFLELVATQTEISREIRSRYVGTTVRLLVDSKKSKTSLFEARMESQAPEIDDVVYLRNATVKSGQFVQARVIEAYDFDLLAEAV